MENGLFGWGNINTHTFKSLKKPIECKWLIIGGGIAGLSAAHFLLEEGETDIVLIEKNTIGSGSTGHSAGMLVYEAEHDWWPHYLKTYGQNATKHYFKEQQEALALVRHLINEYSISCGYESEDLLFLGNTKAESRCILSDFKVRKQLGRASKLIAEDKLSTPLKKRKYQIAELARGEVSVNPLLFARGFANVLQKQGVRIYEHTSCLSIGDNYIQTEQAQISCEKYFICRGVSEPSKKLKKFLTTIGLTRSLTKKELHALGLHGAKMFIDNERDSFYYGKVTKDRRLLVGYGDVTFSQSKHPPGYTHQPHLDAIESKLKKMAPHLLPIKHSWSAPYALSTLDMPLVKIEKDFALVNGGGTQSTTIVAAKYAVAKLVKKKHPLDTLFNPK